MQNKMTRRSVCIAALSGAGTIALGAAAQTPAPTPTTPAAPVKKWQMAPSMPDNLIAPASQWLVKEFGDTFRAKTQGTPFSTNLLCAIACQESGYAWFNKKFRKDRTTSQILRLLVLDSIEGRGVYPKDTAAFIADAKYDQALKDTLITASDNSRKARAITPNGKLYFGYGLFQYDLQNIRTDPKFWQETNGAVDADGDGKPDVGLWGDIGACTDRVISILKTKHAAHPDDMFQTIRAYNGRGPNAEEYARIVQRFEGLVKAANT